MTPHPCRGHISTCHAVIEAGGETIERVRRAIRADAAVGSPPTLPQLVRLEACGGLMASPLRAALAPAIPSAIELLLTTESDQEVEHVLAPRRHQQ